MVTLLSENSIYCGEPDIKTMKDKIRRTLNICRLHIDGVCCVRTTGHLDHKGEVGGNGKGQHRHPWQLGSPGCPGLLQAFESNITLARLPVTNCKSVTSLSRTVSAAEESLKMVQKSTVSTTSNTTIKVPTWRIKKMKRVKSQT